MCASTRLAPVAGSVSITNRTFSAACAIGRPPFGCGWLQKNPPHACAPRTPIAAVPTTAITWTRRNIHRARDMASSRAG